MITHPEKLLFPDDGITKGEVAAYYEAMAPLLLPHLRGRPVTMERYPAGIHRPGFIQKDVSKGFPEWLARVEAPKKAGVLHYPIIDDVRSLLWLANQNCITPHVWASRMPELHKPDLCVIDLDPSHEDQGVLIRATLAVRDLLSELGLKSWLKTSGSKGFHIVVPLDAAAEFEVVWRFARGLGAVLVKRDPAHLTQEFSKADRGDRILVDTGRNGYGATFAAAYAVRPKPGAPVSAPCTWRELERGEVAPQSFTLKTMAARVAEVGELWLELATQGQSLAKPLERLELMLTPDDWSHSKRASTRRPGSRKKPEKKAL
jgi:bifunctional non-homologous end joining protein LigD